MMSGCLCDKRIFDSRGSPPTEPLGEGGSMPTAYGEPACGGHCGAPRPYCPIGLLLYTTWGFTHHCRSNPVDNSNTAGKSAHGGSRPMVNMRSLTCGNVNPLPPACGRG